MELTGIIIFFGALAGFILWVLKILLLLGSADTFIKIYMGGKLTLNILPGIILFMVMAISAGMAWG